VAARRLSSRVCGEDPTQEVVCYFLWKPRVVETDSEDYSFLNDVTCIAPGKFSGYVGVAHQWAPVDSLVCSRVRH
jgi:hypothetical protein